MGLSPDPELLRLPTLARARSLRPPHHQPGQHFLKGPIPKPWLERAAQAPGRALHVGIALWFQAGMKKRGEIRLGLAQFSDFGLDRFAASRGLAELERAGLVSVIRHPGRKPIVTILDVAQHIS